MMEYKEGVSICITAYKAKVFIKETLDSVYSQTWFKDNDNWEVILGIDGCQETLDYVKAIMDRYRNLRVLMMDSNKGTYVTTNTVMKEAQYDWLLRFDADDVMLPNMIETLVTESKGFDAATFLMKNFGRDTAQLRACGQIFVKHIVFDEFGGYMPWKCSADWNFNKRVFGFVKQKMIYKVLFRRRIHTTNLTVAKETSYRSAIRKKYNDQTLKLKLHKRSDAYIKMETNTFKEIYNSIGENNIPLIEDFDFSFYEVGKKKTVKSKEMPTRKIVRKITNRGCNTRKKKTFGYNIINGW